MGNGEGDKAGEVDTLKLKQEYKDNFLKTLTDRGVDYQTVVNKGSMPTWKAEPDDEDGVIQLPPSLHEIITNEYFQDPKALFVVTKVRAGFQGLTVEFEPKERRAEITGDLLIVSIDEGRYLFDDLSPEDQSSPLTPSIIGDSTGLILGIAQRMNSEIVVYKENSN